MIEPYIVAVCQAERVAYRAGGVAKHKQNMTTNLKRYCDLIDFIFSGSGTKSGAFRPQLVTFGEFGITGLYNAVEPGQKAMTRQEIRAPGHQDSRGRNGGTG